MKWLVQDARPGDVFFFHFSGHSRSREGPKPEGAVLPCDHSSEGVIADKDLRDLLVQPLPNGARLTAVMDCWRNETGVCSIGVRVCYF